MGSLEGKVGIVTGASRGIGAAVARAMAAAGAAVALAARDEVALDQVAASIRDAGGRPLVVLTDVGDPAAVAAMVERTVAEFGRLDIACNNAAGGGHPPTPLHDVAVADYDSALQISLRGVFLCMKFEIPALLRVGGGAIVNMGSTAGLEAVGGMSGYVSAKHGLVGLTKVAALDYAAAGVRVNALAPGPILTEHLAAAGPAMQEAAGRAMPMQRIGRPEEVADAVVWLCSDASSFITGVTLPIEGGKLAGMPPFAVQHRSSPLLGQEP